MLWKTIAALIFAFAVSGARGQNILCEYEYACYPDGEFSADNVHRIRTFGGDGPSLKEARWHKTEPIIILLGYYCPEQYTTCPIDGDGDLSVWRVFNDEVFETYFEAIEIRGWSIAYNMPIDQLELVKHKIILGTNAGSLYFLDIGNWDIGKWDTDDWERHHRDADIWDADKWELIKEKFSYNIHIAEGSVSELLLHPSDEWLLVAIDHERLFRFDLASHSASEIKLPTGDDLSLDALAFSDDGRLLANGGNGVIQIWDTDSWVAGPPADLGAESLAKLLFTDDDSQLIVLKDATVSRWSLSGKTLNLLRELQSHPNKRPCHITDGDISPDGSLLMTVDDCGQIRAWDLTADAEIFIPQLDYSNENNPGTVTQFSPDGRFLAKGGKKLGWGLFFVYHSA